MKVIVDDKIPYISEAAQRLFGEVVYLPGKLIGTSDELRDADALIVRTRTLCNRAMLENTGVRFVATATIGFDHICVSELAELGIGWTNCPGCNASSVGQYVRNCLLLVAHKRHVDVSGFCVGIVGYGHVGKEVCKAVEELGCRVLVNDPPLEEQGFGGRRLDSLATLAEECDVVTLHTPLTHEGHHATHHLLDAGFFDSLKRKPVVINAARGGVVDEEALLCAYEQGRVGEMIVDTWENEPQINSTLLKKAFIATPHIAGYSADGKSNATRMALVAVCKHFGIDIGDRNEFLRLTSPPALPTEVKPCGDFALDHLTLYNPLADSGRLKACSEDFEFQRGNYPLRRESF